MEVEYDLTTDDLFAFQWRAAFHSPQARRRARNVYIIWLLALLIIAVIPAIGPGGFTFSRVSWVFLVVAFPTVSLLQWFLERWLMRRAILELLRRERHGTGLLGRHKVVITDAGVEGSTAVDETRTAWAGIDRVEQNDGYIFLYTSVVGAHVIPKRAFKTVQDAEAFYRFATTRLAAR